MIQDVLALTYAVGFGYTFRSSREDSPTFEPLHPVLGVAVSLVWPIILPIALLWGYYQRREDKKAWEAYEKFVDQLRQEDEQQDAEPVE